MTSTEYIPRLRTRLDREDELIADAEDRGSPKEVERHRCTKQRIHAILEQLGDTP